MIADSMPFMFNSVALVRDLSLTRAKHESVMELHNACIVCLAFAIALMPRGGRVCMCVSMCSMISGKTMVGRINAIIHNVL